MDTKFTDKQLSLQVIKNNEEAKGLLQDEDKMADFLDRLEKKLRKVPMFGKQLSNIPIMVSLVRAYMKKEYQDIPTGTVIAIVSALVYFLSPIDLIPDAIPFIGFVDDAAVLSFVWKMVGEDVEAYKKWQVKNGLRSIDDF